MDNIPAHDENLEVHYLLHYPEHSPRENDPHYHLFVAAKKRIKDNGLWKCAVINCKSTSPLNLHHSLIEFSFINGVDLAKFNEAYGLHLTDEEFQVYIESEGNLEVLCTEHHLGAVSVHVLPEPSWRAYRVWRDDLEPPEEKILK